MVALRALATPSRTRDGGTIASLPLPPVPPARRPHPVAPAGGHRRVTRLRLGTNTMQALIVNGKPVAAVTPAGVFIAPRYRATLRATVAGETAYLAGSVPVKGATL